MRKHIYKISKSIVGNKRLRSFLFIFNLYLSAWAVSSPQLDFAKQLINQKQYKAAISTLNSILSNNKYDVDALYWKGYCYQKLENFTAATLNFDAVLQKDPRYVPALLEKANVLKEQQQYEEAIRYYTAVIKQVDTSINVRNSRGMSYYYLGLFEQAIKDFNQVIKMEPLNYLAYNNKGAAIFRNQNIAAPSRVDLMLALSDFNSSLSIKPDFELALRNRGIIRYYLDSTDLAYTDLLRATQLEPKDEDAHHYLGKVLFKQENYPIAIQFFDNAIKLVNYDADMYIDRGNCKIELGNFESARTDFYKALQVKGDRAVIYYNFARCSAAEGDKDKTFYYLREAKSAGLFKNAIYYSYIKKDRYFASWQKDKDFIDLINWIKFGK